MIFDPMLGSVIHFGPLLLVEHLAFGEISFVVHNLSPNGTVKYHRRKKGNFGQEPKW